VREENRLLPTVRSRRAVESGSGTLVICWCSQSPQPDVAVSDAVESARVDQWLWAVRVFKTRSAATEACRGGHVRIEGSSVKPAARLHPGDRIEVRLHGRRRELEVVRTIVKREGATEAAECARDHGPLEPAHVSGVPVRERGSGRPTKRERRQLDRLRR
jgi:ribosome-associated heat shock protein Hsp15